jgi:hypothetical protein
LLQLADAEAMANWESVAVLSTPACASKRPNVRPDRLLRYCARPPSLERSREIDADHLAAKAPPSLPAWKRALPLADAIARTTTRKSSGNSQVSIRSRRELTALKDGWKSRVEKSPVGQKKRPRSRDLEMLDPACV